MNLFAGRRSPQSAPSPAKAADVVATTAAPEFTDVSRRPAPRTPGRGRRTARRPASRLSSLTNEFSGATNRWRTAVHGDEGLADRLERLEVHGWWLLHDLDLPEGVVDHLLIGPAGVHAVFVRTHAHRKVLVGDYGVRVDGRQLHDVDGLIELARVVSYRLSLAVGHVVPVRPVLVALTHTVVPEVHVARQPRHITVLDRTNSTRWLLNQPETLSPAAVDEVFEVARRSTTWDHRRVDRAV